MHRFEVKLDRLPAGAPPFVLRIVVSGTDVELHPSITLPTLDSAERLFSGSEYRGRMTGISDGMMCGWVINQRNPHENPVLTLFDGNRPVLTQVASERISAAIDTGVLANVYYFELPLPMSLLDGNEHLLSVSVGQSRRDLAGCPVLFGLSDVRSVGRSLVSVLDALQRLDRRVDSLQPVTDLNAFEKQVTRRILDRIDMLLNIHRDSIEREMAITRRQLTHVIRHVPAMEPDVILPVGDQPRLEDERIPTVANFSAIERSAPLLTYDLSTRVIAAKPSGAFKWFQSESRTGIFIAGSGGVELDGNATAPASLILQGEGARDPFEFSDIVASFDGQPMSGRFDISESDEWTFIGTTIGGSKDGSSVRGLTLHYVPGSQRPRGTLTLSQIAVFASGRVPARTGTAAPVASVINLGVENASNGWHPAEAGPHGGICWMGAQSELTYRVRRSRKYRLYIPEVRPLSKHIMPKLQISLDGVPAALEIAPLPYDRSAYAVKGICSLPDGADEDLVLRLSFPKEFVSSPMELGLNEDRRPLTIAVRAIGICAST
jgi:hypothetical protein